MSKYSLLFKYRAVRHYHQVHSQQRTAEHFNVSPTHLRRWIAAYRTGGIAAYQYPPAAPMKTKRKKTFIVDKPDHAPKRNGLKSDETSGNILNREFTAGKPADKWLTELVKYWEAVHIFRRPLLIHNRLFKNAKISTLFSKSFQTASCSPI